MPTVEKDLCPPRFGDPVRVAYGGMGDLYRAVDGVLNRPVAVKLLAERFAADEEIRSRFRREALVAARLSGEPHTVTIFDVGEWRGRPFIVMEYLGGGTVEQILRRGTPTLERSLELLGQAALALDAAHALGVVHRDIKPANLLLDDAGSIRVADFGVATAAGLDSLTLTGTVLGTAGYLAPEQAQGQPVTTASDRYALGVVAYELLTGTRPFARESLTGEAAAHIHERVPPASGHNPALPRAVNLVFLTALAKDPAERYPSCAAFISALRLACGYPADVGTSATMAAATTDPLTRVIRPNRPRRWPAAAAGLALLAAAGLGGALAVSALRPSRTAASPPVTRTVTKTTTITARTRTVTSPVTPAVQPATATGTNASDLNTQGYRLMLAGNYAGALPLLRQAVAGLSDPANPVTAYANFNLGQTLVRLGQCASAIPYLQRAQQLEPSRQEVSKALGYAQQCAGTPSVQPPDSAGPRHGPRHNHGANQQD
jgi:eukaryotic-like serine/threonine-protein kinase